MASAEGATSNCVPAAVSRHVKGSVTLVGRPTLGAGFLWVRRSDPHGIAHQVWEDSGDSHYHADGSIFDPTRPFAPVAVQGYTYDALLWAAELVERRTPDEPISVEGLRKRAFALRTDTLTQFWQADLGTFAQALTVESDGTTRPARVVASSPGHLLATALLDGEDVALVREALIARFQEADLLAATGVRTKSTAAPRFSPGAYHNGSSWPMDTGVIADGLRRHGHHAQANDLEARVLRACSTVGGFPEFFRGDLDDCPRVNTSRVDLLGDGVIRRLEQPPQANQGWTATRVWRILSRRRAADPTATRAARKRRS